MHGRRCHGGLREECKRLIPLDSGNWFIMGMVPPASFDVPGAPKNGRATALGSGRAAVQSCASFLEKIGGSFPPRWSVATLDFDPASPEFRIRFIDGSNTANFTVNATTGGMMKFRMD